MKRHNMVAKAIGKDLRNKGWTVQLKKWVRDGRVNYRPDIIAWRGRRGFIGDVRIPYEKNDLTLNKCRMDKEDKYAGLLNKVGFPDTVINRDTKGFIIGTTGTMTEENCNPFRELQIVSKFNNYCRIAAQGSCAVWRLHTKT